MPEVLQNMMLNTCPADSWDDEMAGLKYRMFVYNLHCSEMVILAEFRSLEEGYEILESKIVEEGAMHRLKVNGNYQKPEIEAVLDENGEQKFSEA